jgi:hypothetical protein
MAANVSKTRCAILCKSANTNFPYQRAEADDAVPQEAQPMNKVCSIFSQVLKFFSRGDFEKAVKEH